MFPPTLFFEKTQRKGLTRNPAIAYHEELRKNS